MLTNTPAGLVVVDVELLSMFPCCLVSWNVGLSLLKTNNEIVPLLRVCMRVNVELRKGTAQQVSAEAFI